MLKTQELPESTEASKAMQSIPSTSFPDVQDMPFTGEPPDYMSHLRTNNPLTDPQLGPIVDTLGMVPEEEFSWELISLGLEEPLPSQDFINEMYVFTRQLAISGD